MSKPIFTSLLLSSLVACASSPRPEPTARIATASTVSCEVAPQPSAPAFPVAIDPRLPSVDRIARLVENELGARAAAEVQLCVSSEGRVVEISLVRETGSQAFDAAVLHDVAEWQFAAPAARTCKHATISYVASARMAAR